MTSKMSEWQVFLRLCQHVKPQVRSLVFGCALYLPIVSLLLAQPLIIGTVVDSGFRSNNLDQISMWASLYLLVIVCHGLFEFSQLYLMNRIGLILVRHLRNQLFAKIQKLPLAYFDRTPMGRVLTRITSDTESLSEIFSSGAVQIIGDIIFLFGTVVMIFVVDMRLSGFAMLTMPVLIGGVLIFRKYTKQSFIWVRSRLSLLNGFLQEYLSNVGIIQQSVKIDHALKEFDLHNVDYMRANRQAIFLDASIFGFVDAMSSITVAVVLIGGGILQNSGMLQLGIIVAFIEALNRFFVPVREVANRYTIFQSALVSGARVFEFLDLPEEHNSAHRILDRPQEVSAIKFEEVSFWYKASHPILNNLSFTVRKNEKIALVGHTGAGKSTITKLFTRLYEVSQGKITVDGTDIREFSLFSLRSLFSYVPQDVFLFEGTLRENLALGREQVSDQEIHDSLRLCQAGYLLDREGGLDARVQHRGQNFSLGERQLLALVRCLITDSPFIVLDEATASIDHHTEKSLQIATSHILKNRSAVIVAHRLSTIRDCDRIFVLQEGRIVEQGSHEQLIAQHGLYAHWLALQERHHQELIA